MTAHVYNTGTSLIITRRLRMRSYHAGMVTDQHLAWLNDPLVTKYSEQRHKTHTPESQHEYLNKLWKNPGSNIWLIKLADKKEIGTISSHIDIHNQVANIGILIGDKDYWGQGLGLEAWIGVMNVLRAAGVRKIEAGCMESNEPMIKLLLSAEFRKEGIIPDHFMLDGKPEDLALFGWAP